MLSAQQDTSFMINVNKLLNDKNNNNSLNIDLANKYGKYIKYNKNSKQWVMDIEKITKACKYNGYFAIRTNEIIDPFKSLEIYREQNIVKTAFRQLKVLNNAQRLQCTQTSYKGKIFIHLQSNNR